MHSDAPGRRGPVARLADLLAEAAAGSRPTSTELAELLWLAGQMEGADPTRPEASADAAPTEPTPPQVSPSPTPRPADPAPAPAPDDRVPLLLPARPDGDASAASASPEDPSRASDAPATEAADHTPVRVPVPPMVTHPLTLQRALRPLKRRVPSPVGQVIDEEATADRIARLGGHPRGWLPVLRPAEERWLRLCLVHDAGPTMPIWRPLVHELHTALAQSGIFRTVELHRAEADGTVPPQAAHAPAAGRTVTLVISDCMGPQWRAGAAGTRWYRTLRRWAAHQPVAVIQPLPERLWRTTALPTTPGSLSAPHPAAPSAALAFTPYAASEAPPGEAVPVPVLEPAGTWLSHWAALVAGGARVPGAVGWLGQAPPGAEAAAEDVTRASPEDLVLRFRSTASPEAFRLAGHLAVGEAQLPVMRLVQAAVEERPRPQHLAEVILSGMLSSGGDAGSYEFRDGVRDLLLRTLPRTARGRTRELLARVGGLIDERAGTAPGELRAVAASGGGAGPETPAGEPFATVTPDSVRQLGGGRGPQLLGDRYRMVRRIGQSGSVWLAEDLRRGGEPVVVQRYPQAPQWLRGDFTRAARQLSRFRHAQVAAVRDYANGEVPYVVMDFIEGRNLAELLADHPDGLPTHLLLDLVPPLARAVSALHTAGMTHGALSPDFVRLPPHGGAVLCGFTLIPYGEESCRADLAALGRLVRQMYTGAGEVAVEGIDEVSSRLRPGLGDPGGAVEPGGVDEPGGLGDPGGVNEPGGLGEALLSAVTDLGSADPGRRSQALQRLTQLSTPASHERTYSLLGPLRVARGGRPLATGSAREQAMLCMLLLGRGRDVPHDELLHGMWGGGDRPADAPRLLGTYASRLRNALGPDSVVAGSGTYALALPTGPDVVDLFRFQRLHDDARDARFAGDFVRARELVGAALDLWRGTPLEGVPGPAARATRAEINRLRQSLLHARLELNRELGATEQEQTELTELLREFPATEDEVPAPQEELPSDQLDDLGVQRETADDQPVTPPTTLTFEYLARPAGSQEDVRQNLGREISHLLIRGGITPDQFAMRSRPRGWDVTVAPEVHVLHVLTTTVNELPAALEAFPVLGLGVTFTHEPDPTVSAPTIPSGPRHLLGRDGRRAVVIVSNDLHQRLTRSGRLPHRFDPVPQSDDWYCEVSTEPPPAPLPAIVEAVLLGFDGTLARLYSDQSARHAARALTALIAERRDPEAALAGTPLLPGGSTRGGTADRVHPMDVLRPFARHRTLAEELRLRLEEIEMQAALTAKPEPYVASVLRTLAQPERALRLAVVTDTSPRAVVAYLGAKGLHLPEVEIHGRTSDLTLLMPDPDCPRRALEQLGIPADRCVMVGSTTAEAAAARSLGVAFIGYAPSPKARERLTATGAHTTISDLSHLPDMLPHP
ncbi:SAV_2336 N-terminal domain-related protein [Streptomyces sp. NPDC051214]|uniref:SAV_2336 N-terminal domain-related protein n=1 Tax=Streptomyces sp. NPDC051214 TaxID=3155282 RepID=UPI003424AC66